MTKESQKVLEKGENLNQTATKKKNIFSKMNTEEQNTDFVHGRGRGVHSERG